MVKVSPKPIPADTDRMSSGKKEHSCNIMPFSQFGGGNLQSCVHFRIRVRTYSGVLMYLLMVYHTISRNSEKLLASTMTNISSRILKHCAAAWLSTDRDLRAYFSMACRIPYLHIICILHQGNAMTVITKIIRVAKFHQWFHFQN